LEESNDRAGGAARAERLFGRVGLAAIGLGLVVCLLAADVALTRLFRAVRAGGAAFEMNLQTRDGRRVGGTPGGVEFVLSPGTLYASRPGQPLPGVSINSHGLRGAEPAARPDRPRVLVVGGSGAFGHGVADDETFAARLAALEPGWEVLNGGVIGYLAQQELAAVVHDWIDLAPDAIVAFDGWNDAYDPYWWSLARPGGPPHPGVNSNFRVMEDRLADFWRVRTDPRFALAELARSIARSSTLFSLLTGGAAAPELPPAGDDRAWLDPAVRHYVDSLRKLRDFAGVRGVQLLVVVQPERSQRLAGKERTTLETWQRDFMPGDRYHESFPDSYARFRARAVAELAKQRIQTFDASAALLAGAQGATLFLDPVHLSASGHAAMARLLAPRIERMLGGAPRD
jgi:hypothetical protein